MTERTWLISTIMGLALIALAGLLPASKAGYQFVRPICIGGGLLLVTAAQLRLMRLHSKPTNDDVPAAE